MSQRELDPRKELILKVVTDDYIESAEPVGSRTIARKYNLGLSPATIRNEMADLEESGYLKQPHVSAGRIPSQQGYRYYVDMLMQQQKLKEEEQGLIRLYFEDRSRELDTILQQTVKILAQLTRYPSLMLGPTLQPSIFKHVQLIPLSANDILVLIVTDMGIIENKVIAVDCPVTQADLDRASYSLNKKLRGRPFASLKSSVLNELKEEIKTEDSSFQQAVTLLLSSLDTREKERVYLDGIINILEHPEFKELEKFKLLLELMEEEERLCRLLSSPYPGIRISIGEENPEEAAHECSIITANYEIGGRVVGTIGVLGPTRMDYAHVVSVVEFIAQSLSEFLSKS
ncbi:MAG TPA: heat-inducible transcription repressor HrcA [Hydrogenispora sp.]|jgi:heat-inducible transcriptional repressor|nr:heat-inducible transcription repressor HrcA [Hydrogenispora sp.]